jgi:hypothetical protein
MTILRNRGHGVCKLSKSNKQVKLEKRTKHAIRCQSKGSCAIMPYFMVVAPLRYPSNGSRVINKLYRTILQTCLWKTRCDHSCLMQSQVTSHVVYYLES